MLLTRRFVLNAGDCRTAPATQDMLQSPAPRRPTSVRSRRRRGIGPLLAAGPIALALLAGGCSETEDLSDYLADVASYIEDDEEIFGEDVVPGADQPYRTLHEVPDEAPAVSSPEERAGVIRGLVADREQARHTATQLRARIERDEETETADPSPPGGE